MESIIKLCEIDAGDLYLQQTAARRSQVQQDRAMPTKGVWLVDRASGKKLAGPFADDDKAIAFKRSRTDRIPPDARLVTL